MVVYHEDTNFEASFWVAYVLKYYGFSNVRVLEGGLHHFTSEASPLPSISESHNLHRNHGPVEPTKDMVVDNLDYFHGCLMQVYHQADVGNFA